MLIAVDETGGFKENPQQQFGIVTLVTITDAEWIKFKEFISKIYQQGFENVKSKDIDFENRYRLINYISSKSQIKYTSFIFDLSLNSNNAILDHQKRQVQKANDSINKYKNIAKPKMLQSLELLRNQINKLNIGEYAKYVAYTNIYAEWQKYFQFDFIYVNQSCDNWTLHHVIDSQNESEKFRQLVKYTLKLGTNYLSKDGQVYTPQEWIKHGHPLSDYLKYKGSNFLQDGNKLYEDFTIGNEQTYPQLFLPDFIGNCIYRSILNYKEKKWLKIVKKLKNNRSLAIINEGKKNYFYLIYGLEKNKLEMNEFIKNHHNALES